MLDLDFVRLKNHTSGQLNAMAAVSEACKAAYSDVGGWRKADQLPIVYHPSYNIGFFGLEKIHPFDSNKFRRIVELLRAESLVQLNQMVRPTEATLEQLRDVHTAEYLEQLHGSSRKVAAVVQLPPVALLPNFLTQNRVTKPFRYHVGGTMLAAGLSLEFGWSINIGGGMHHARYNDGDGWCAYSDLILALRRLRSATGGAVQKCLIVDLDVHQGNGHERDKLHFEDTDLYILDIYGQDLWPGDHEAKEAINIDIGIPCGTADAEYLEQTRRALQRAFSEFEPDIILYNAGTDILIDDPLGQMRVSADGIAARDEMVWGQAAQAGVPICMVLSGGYARNNYRVVGNSIAGLLRKFRLIRADGTPQQLRPLEPDVAAELPS